MQYVTLPPPPKLKKSDKEMLINTMTTQLNLITQIQLCNAVLDINMHICTKCKIKLDGWIDSQSNFIIILHGLGHTASTMQIQDY